MNNFGSVCTNYAYMTSLREAVGLLIMFNYVWISGNFNYSPCIYTKGFVVCGCSTLGLRHCLVFLDGCVTLLVSSTTSHPSSCCTMLLDCFLIIYIKYWILNIPRWQLLLVKVQFIVLLPFITSWYSLYHVQILELSWTHLHCFFFRSPSHIMTPSILFSMISSQCPRWSL